MGPICLLLLLFPIFRFFSLDWRIHEVLFWFWFFVTSYHRESSLSLESKYPHQNFPVIHSALLPSGALRPVLQSLLKFPGTVHFHKYKMRQKFQQGPHDIGCCQKKGLIGLSAKVYAQNVALDWNLKGWFWKTCWIESVQGEVGWGVGWGGGLAMHILRWEPGNGSEI